MIGQEAWKFILLIVMVAGLTWIVLHRPASARDRACSKLKPRTSDDCPKCRAAHLEGPHHRPLPRPYPQIKSPRGSKKRLATAGYACPNSGCLYFGITDTCTAPHAVRCKCDQIHALVGCGHHGRHERIQDLRCQACRTKFSVRAGTILYRLKHPPIASRKCSRPWPKGSASAPRPASSAIANLLCAPGRKRRAAPACRPPRYMSTSFVA